MHENRKIFICSWVIINVKETLIFTWTFLFGIFSVSVGQADLCTSCSFSFGCQPFSFWVVREVWNCIGLAARVWFAKLNVSICLPVVNVIFNFFCFQWIVPFPFPHSFFSSDVGGFQSELSVFVPLLSLNCFPIHEQKYLLKEFWFCFPLRQLCCVNKWLRNVSNATNHARHSHSCIFKTSPPLLTVANACFYWPKRLKPKE